MIIDKANSRVVDHVWAYDAEMINGVASLPLSAVSDLSRVRFFPQADTISGALRAVVQPGVGISITSSVGNDYGLVYCEVIL